MNISRLLVVWGALRNVLVFFKIIPFPLVVNHFFENIFVKPKACFNKKCNALTKFRQSFLKNLLVGFLIAALLWFSHGIPLLRDLEGSAIDWVIRLYSGTSPSDYSGTSLSDNIPLVLFDIDEESHRKWGEPVVTPRNKLLKLIKFAVCGKAAVIVVDIDVTQRYDAEIKADDALIKYFKEFPVCSHQEKEDGFEKPLVVFMRTFHGQLSSEKNSDRKQRVSFLEKELEESPKIIWANPAFISEWDSVVRRWLLWEKTIYKKDLQVLPSVQLVVATYLACKGGDIHKLMKSLNMLRSETNKNSVSIQTNETLSECLKSLNFKSSTDYLQQRIIYRIPWVQKKGEARAKIDFNGQRVPVFSKYSADRLINTKQTTDEQFIAGRIVLIGSSTQDSRDIYKTPLGEMPGVLILANAINSLLENGQIHPPSLVFILLIEFLLILMITSCFTRYSPIRAMLFSGGIIIAVLIPISLVFFKQGLWIDFAIPLFAVQLHEMYKNLKYVLKNKDGGE